MTHKKHVKKILWIALFRGIGDAVLFYPALKHCMDTFPDSEVSIVLNKANTADVLKVYGFRGKIRIKPPGRLSLLLWLFRVGIKKYDIVFDASSIEQMHVSRWLTWIFSKGDRTGYHYGSSSWLYNKRLDTKPLAAMHQKDIYANMLNPYIKTKTIKLEKPENNILLNHSNKTNKTKQKTVVIHPGARDQVETFNKRWPAKNYAQLIEKLACFKDIRIVIIGTYEEIKLLKPFVAKPVFPEVINIMGKTSVADLFTIIRGSSLFIGNNSGPLHIAAAYQIPIITFAGGISMQRWGIPAGDFNIVLGLDKRCRVCSEYHCKDHGNPCLEAVSVDEAYKAAKKVMSNFIDIA